MSKKIAVAGILKRSTYIIPAGTSPELAEPLSTVAAAAVTLVVEKSGGEWKIVHSHISNLEPPAAG